MSFFRKGAILAVAASALFGASLRAEAADTPTDTKVTFALPVLSLTFSYAYLADAQGYWKDQGLQVDLPLIAGTATAQAMMAGDVEFAAASGTNMLSAIAHGQNAIAIASTHNQMLIELVLSKAAAAKTGLTVEHSTVAQRAAALKGMTIAVDGPNTILDAYLEHIVALGGLTPQKDVITTATPAPASNAALEAGRIDGFSMSAPWPQIATQKGTGVLWISAPRGDLPELQPFAFNAITARPDYCPKNPDICRKFLKGVQQAMDFMTKNPDQALALIAPKFKEMDPAVLKAGFEQQRRAITPGISFSEKQFEITQNFAVDAGMLKPTEKRTTFAGKIYTNDYTK